MPCATSSRSVSTLSSPTEMPRAARGFSWGHRRKEGGRTGDVDGDVEEAEEDERELRRNRIHQRREVRLLQICTIDISSMPLP